jgi:hypothetical protein
LKEKGDIQRENKLIMKYLLNCKYKSEFNEIKVIGFGTFGIVCQAIDSL